jgi:hypothetical protein
VFHRRAFQAFEPAYSKTGRLRKGQTRGVRLLDTAIVRGGLIGMVSGDEIHRRTNEKPTRPNLAAYCLTATSGTEDGTNG